NETAQAWRIAVERRDGPTALALTRQNVPNLAVPAGVVDRGGYVLAEAATVSSGAASGPEVLLIGSGSEVSLCLAAQVTLAEQGVAARVVSLPSFELFEEQDADYRESVLPSAVTARVTVEAGSAFGWDRYAGADGVIIGIDHF